MKKHLLLLLITFILPFSLFAVIGGENYNISLMTIGPGKPLYVWWGHIGLIVEDSHTESSDFYDFGNFSFEGENFYGNFLMGRLYYLSIKSRADLYLRYLTHFDRSVTIYELNLTNDEKVELVGLLKEAVQPENQVYLYHHYENNCSTRIRDLLDQVLGGLIRENSQSYALSYREQINRFIGPFWGYLPLNYLQGASIDAPITNWDAQFLPHELENRLNTLNRPNGEPLVKKKIMLIEGAETNLPDTAYPRLGEAFLRGMMLFILTLLIRLKNKEWGKGFWRIFSVLLTALPGLLLFFMMFFTDHHVTQNNLNLLVTFPFLILTLIPAVLYNKKSWALSLFHLSWDVQAALVLLSLLSGTLPHFNQDNFGVILFYLPLYLAWGSPGHYLIEVIKLPQRSFKWSQKFQS